jgi:phosphohistidine phosphatase
MKYLILLRHGEAEHSSGSDISRHLSSNGKSSLNSLGQTLKKKSMKVDRMYCSTALRTVETAEQIKRYVPVGEECYTDEIYSANLEKLLTLLEKTPGEVQTCMLIGHNPSLSLLATYLSSGDYLSLQPGMMVILDMEIDDWRSVGMGTASLREVLS